MRFTVLGDTGSGKTLLAVDYLKECFDKGYTVWSNIDLGFDFNLVDSTNFTDVIDPRVRNAVLIDEVGEINTGICRYNFGQLLAQSRKSVGENQLFIMTAQVSQQASTVMKGMVDYLVYPEIIVKDGKTDKPVVVKADFYRKMQRTSIPMFSFYTSDYRNVYDSCDLYDTYQMVDALSDGRVNKYLKKYSEFISTKGTLTDLSTLLQEKEGLNIAESKRMARKIIHAVEWGLMDG